MGLAPPKLAGQRRERRRVPGCGFGALLAAVVLAGSPVFAQEAPTLRPHRITLGGGIVWSGGYSIGVTSAELRGNGVGSSPPPFLLFAMDSSIQSAIGADGHVGFTVTPPLALEAGFGYSRPNIAVTISGDEEAAPATLDEAETLQQYVIGGAAVWQLPRVRLGSHVRPYVIGGGAYLRQLYQEQTLVETGQIIFAGGGVRYWLRGGSGSGGSLGLRADVRVNWRRQGVEFEDRTRAFPSFAASLFWQP